MLRKITLAGAFAGLLAAVPYLYEHDREAFERFVFGRSGQTHEPETAPMVALAQPQAAHGRRVRLSADRQGHFNGEFRMNGRAVPALIDTGATAIAINRSTARRIGLFVSPPDFTIVANTANGRVKAAPVLIDRIEIGGIDLRDVQAVVLEDEALSGTLVGMSFLSRLKRYQVEGGAMVLEQ